MRYLNLILTIIAVILLAIYIRLAHIDRVFLDLKLSNAVLMNSNNQLDKSINDLRFLFEPVVRRYFKR